MGSIILIGGAPTVGKSYLARALSEDLKLPWISSDGIRDMMRRLVRHKDYPKLFNPEGTTAEEFLRAHTPQQIVDLEIEQSIEAWKGVKAFIDADFTWKDFIIEGVNILPKLVAEYESEHTIIPLFLVDDDEARTKEVVYTRGLWDDAKTYSDDVKPVEVKWALLFSQWLEGEAKKYGFPCIKIGSKSETVRKAKEIIERRGKAE